MQLVALGSYFSETVTEGHMVMRDADRSDEKHGSSPNELAHGRRPLPHLVQSINNAPAPVRAQ